jgi:hypothetical protein
LSPTSPLYALAFAGQGLFYVLAAYGAYLERRDRRSVDIEVPILATSRQPLKGFKS